MNTIFNVPRLVKEGAWLDYRGRYNNGYTGFGSRALSEIRFAAPHHSVTNPTGSAAKDCDTLFNIHANNGWNMIGYNFVITSEEVNGFAKVAYVGDLATVRAHTPNTKGAKGMAAGLGNRYIVAACIIGQNHLTLPTQAQLRSMKLLMQELLFFENNRLPNLWPQWDDMWPHYTWDWTQCNGMTKIRQMIIDATIPAEKSATPAPVWKAMDVPRSMRAKKKVNIINLDTNKVEGTIASGKDTPFVQKKEQNGKLYLRSKWSTDNKKNWGVNIDDLSEIPVVVPPVVEKPKPIVRALGAIMTVKVNNGDKVIDIITKAVTKTYTKDEPFEATHTIEFEGKTYYMTDYSYKQYEKGKNPTGIDKSTVDAWVIVPTEPDPTPLPPIEEKPEVPIDLIEQHDKDIADLDKRVGIIEQFIELLKKAWRAIFNKNIGE